MARATIGILKIGCEWDDCASGQRPGHYRPSRLRVLSAIIQRSRGELVLVARSALPPGARDQERGAVDACCSGRHIRHKHPFDLAATHNEEPVQTLPLYESQ